MANPSSYTQLLESCLRKTPWDELSDDQASKMVDYMWDITKKAAREDFYTFVKVMAPVLIPGFKTGRHIDIICHQLQNLYEAIQDNDKSKSKMQVFLPPESTKTVMCSHLFPAWLLGKHPDYRIIAVAHSAEHAAKELGGNSKRILNLPEYQEIFPKTKVSRESSGSGFWKTTKYGYYYSGGSDSQYPGKRANLLICDDVVSEKTPVSKLKTINHDYSSGLESRLLEDNSGQLIVNTRWYLDDISGFTVMRDGGVCPITGKEYLNKDGKLSDRPWQIISVPAILDEDGVALMHRESDPKDKYIIGGSYWPEHKGLDNLLEKKRIHTPHQWNALFMQSPIPTEGNIFSQDMFQWWRHSDPPEVSNIIISLDTAFSEKKTKDSAESVYQIWGIFPMRETTYDGKESVAGNMILLGYNKGHWSFPELKDTCKGLFEEYGQNLDFFLIEDRASGQSLIQELQAIGIPVVPYNPEKDKISRAHSASALIHSGRVYLNPNLMFTQEFLAEILKFPAGGLDTTDAFSQAVLWMRDNWHIIPQDYTTYLRDEDSDGYRTSFQRRPSTYWGSVSKH